MVVYIIVYSKFINKNKKTKKNLKKQKYFFLFLIIYLFNFIKKINKNLFFIHLIIKKEIFNYIYFIFKINNKLDF